MLEPNKELIIHNSIANIIPENQLEIINPSTKWSVSKIIKKQIIVEIKPKVIKLIGKVKKRNMDHTVAFTNHNTKATNIAVINPSTLTHGVK